MPINRIFFLMYLFCLSAAGVDVTVYVNGGILSQSCNVSSQDLIKNVNFPDLDPKDFKQIGDTSAVQSLSIRLEKCTGMVSNLSYKFSGQADDVDPTLLKVTGNSASSEGDLATGLAIEILDKNKDKISLGSVQFLNSTITGATYALNFFLRYRSTSQNVSAGNASSVVYLDIYYE